MKKVIVIMTLVLITALACIFTSRVPGTQPSPTNGNQQTQTIPPTQTKSINIQDITSGQSRWDFNIPLPIGYSNQELYWWGYPLTVLNNKENGPNENSITLREQSYFVDNGSVYFSDINQKPTKIDLESGNLIWQSDIQGSILGLGKSIALVYRDDNRIYALDKSSGEEKWKVIIPALVSEGTFRNIKPYYSSIEYQDYIFVPVIVECGASSTDSLIFLQFNESTGFVNITSCIDTEKLLAFSDGIFIASDTDGSGYTFGCSPDSIYIAGINPFDGRATWIESNENRCQIILEIDTQNNLIYINHPLGEGKYDLYCINMKTGINAWGASIFAINNLLSSDYEVQFNSFMNFTLSKDIIIFNSEKEILVFQKNNGILVNRFPQERSYLTFLTENNGLIVHYPDLGIVQGVEPLTSQVLWENDELSLGDNLITVGDIILFEDKETHEVFALDPKTGDELWRQVLSGSCVPSLWPPTKNHFAKYTDSIIYKGCQNGIYSLNPHSGNEHLLVDTPLDAVSINIVDNDLWLVQFTSQLTLIELK
jgi:outer membrane protein assembly factor BamB